jgi:UDP-N-acetylmuramate--alanine ligase
MCTLLEIFHATPQSSQRLIPIAFDNQCVASAAALRETKMSSSVVYVFQKMELKELNKIYFLGIGGIGMSALARYFKRKDAEIHGYDKTETTLTKKLEKEGMTIHYGEADLTKIPAGLDLVVWTPAIPRNFPELLHFQQSGIPLKKRAEVLGIISRSQRTIAIAGTHGKTTTSSLVTHLLRTGGVRCTAFLGGISQNLRSNYVGGDSDWVVAEADEYDRSFLHLSPEISVLLSMDPDHLDIYGKAEAVAETGFKEFIKKTKPNGKVFIKQEFAQHFDNQLFEMMDGGQSTVDGVAFASFGLEEGTYRAEHIRVKDGWFVFDFVAPVSDPSWEATPSNRAGGNRSYEEVRFEGLRLGMPGRHNVENATAAIAVALNVGIKPAAIRKALATFKGIKRRFEFIYRDEKTVFIDDYAHHPTEIRAAVSAAKELFPGRKIMGIFQPHLYSRTRDFQDGFAEELDNLDEIILLDIYPAREEPIPGVTSAIIFDKMKNPNKVLIRKGDALNTLKNRDLEVLMTIGAGDIDTLVLPLKRYLKRR